MEIKQNHDLKLENRNKLFITGISKIDSLNSEEFLIQTSYGLLLVKGENLLMQQLDIDKGNIWIEGNVTGIEYINETKDKKPKTGFVGKLFKWSYIMY